jgi:PhnB protein
MSRVSTYLNFPGTAEEAFNHYAKVFGTQVGPITRMSDMGDPNLPDKEKNMVGHVEMPILAGHVIMATDALESMGHECRIGNNTTINLEPDTREETDRLYDALSDGGSEGSGLSDMPWGYWGTCLDRFGIRWMFNCYPS